MGSHADVMHGAHHWQGRAKEAVCPSPPPAPFERAPNQSHAVTQRARLQRHSRKFVTMEGPPGDAVSHALRVLQLCTPWEKFLGATLVSRNAGQPLPREPSVLLCPIVTLATKAAVSIHFHAVSGTWPGARGEELLDGHAQDCGGKRKQSRNGDV